MMNCISNKAKKKSKGAVPTATDIRPWEKLANAIVEQAVIDYRKARARVRANPENADRAKADLSALEVFFRSSWFEALTDVDGGLVLSKLRKEAA